MTPQQPTTNFFPVNFDPESTSQSTAQMNSKISALQNIAIINNNRQILYDGAVLDFNANMEAGNAPASIKAPVAPPLAVLDPPKTDADYYGWIDSPTLKITSSIPVDTFNHNAPPAHPPQMVIHIGNPIGGAPGWYTIGPDDTFPNGLVTPPQPDFGGATFQRVGSAMGKNTSTGIFTGWYFKQS